MAYMGIGDKSVSLYSNQKQIAHPVVSSSRYCSHNETHRCEVATQLPQSSDS